MSNIGDWTEDRLNNWMAQRFNLQGNVRSLVNRAVADATVPSGVIAYTAASSAPDGWVAAEGQVLSTAAYGPLWDALGATYNDGSEGVGNFRLPDLRGRGLVGLGTHADVDALTDSDGLAVALRTPRHAHHKSSFASGTPVYAGVGRPPTKDGSGTVAVTPFDFYFGGHTHDVPAFDTDTNAAAFAVGLAIIKI